MPAPNTPRPLNIHRPQRSTESFRAYCESELERLRNSGEALDEALFREAMDSVMRKLRHLEEEGLA